MVGAWSPGSIRLGIAEWSVPIAGPISCRYVARAGLDGLQVDLGPASAGYPLSRPLVRHAYQEAAADAGIELVSLAANELCIDGLDVTPDSDGGRRARATMAAAIAATAALGLDLVQFPCFEGSFVSSPEQRRNMADGLRFACNLAADHGITVATENVLSIDETDELFERVDADNLSVFFDMQNYLLNRGFDQVAQLDALYDRVAQAHAKDGTGGVLSSAIVGTGEARVADQITLMVDRGYTGWISLENFYTTGPLAQNNPEPFDTMAEDAAALRTLVETAQAGGPG
ncbi:MAG: sugar phosphate isomerase/epimerase family protein [Acidimicrobiales bacterium]